jgi:hypothetical protein
MGNNPAQDRYNPRGVNSPDFEYFRFSEVPAGELVWFSDNPNPNQNHAFRKLTETTAMDTKTQVIQDIETNTHSYQKI